MSAGNVGAKQALLPDRGVLTKFGVTIRRNATDGKQCAGLVVNDALHWNLWRTPYLSDFEIPWVFYIHLNPIMFLGPVELPGAGGNEPEIREHVTIKEKEKYWISESRVHLGGHVFIERNGTLIFMSSYVGYHYIRVTEHGFHTTRSSLIYAVYPSIRQEERILSHPLSKTIDGKPLPCGCRANEVCNDFFTVKMLEHKHYYFNLVIGLKFLHHEDKYYPNQKRNRPDPNYRNGDRYYARFRQNIHVPLKAGRVYEITEQALLDFKKPNQPDWPQPPEAFAIYVCSGARLVVVDLFHLDEFEVQKHNRTLVEQGGLVVGGYDLYLCSSKSDYNVPLAQILPEPLGAAQKKVLFLGANESEYNSITWELQILRERGEPPNDLISRRERAFLIMPEGGYIEGIENWTDGMAEVLARHQYERLHEPNVQMDSGIHLRLPFKAPNDQMLRKILGVGMYMSRGFTCNYRYPFRYDSKTRLFYNKLIAGRNGLPKQYNHRKCLFHMMPKTETTPEPFRPPVPPLYPPVLDNDGKCYWMPLPRPETLVRPKKQEWGYKVFDDYLIRNEDQVEYRYRAAPGVYVETVEYEMERLISPDQDTADQECDGITTRLGVDGWLYGMKKTDGKYRKIGRYLSLYYREQ